MARIADTEVWRADGDRSADRWLARQIGTSAAGGGAPLETGRQLEVLPATADAVLGQISECDAECGGQFDAAWQPADGRERRRPRALVREFVVVTKSRTSAAQRAAKGAAFIAAVLTDGEKVQRVVHLGRRFTATQRTALQWQDPVCAR